MWWIMIIGGVLVLVGLGLVMRSGGQSESGIIEVRRTPRREIEDLTVDEFRDLGVEYLADRGFELRVQEEHYVATRDGVSRLVHFDPAAEGSDPRTLNQLVAQIRRFNLDGGVLVTSGSITGQARDLAEKADVLLLDPDELIGWRRSRTPDE